MSISFDTCIRILSLMRNVLFKIYLYCRVLVLLQRIVNASARLLSGPARDLHRGVVDLVEELGFLTMGIF